MIRAKTVSTREHLELLRLYPSFSVINAAAPIRVSVRIKRPRVSIGLGNCGNSAYITGFVDAPDSKEEAIHAFLTDDEDRRMLQRGRRALKAALIEGEWQDHVRGIGFSLSDCAVHEEEL